MKTAFKEIAFQEATLKKIAVCDAIIGQYQAQGLRLTLRQLYYQFVSKNLIENSEKSYKSLGGVVSDARLAGLLDWDAIEDRNREPRILAEYKGPKEMLEDALLGYRRRRWQGQRCYVELWVEKAALAGVLKPLADEFHVTLMVNRGYSSQSAMYESAMRFQRKGNLPGYRKHQPDKRVKEPVLFYLKNHNPSNKNIIHNIQNQFQIFQIPIHIKKLTLTINQIHTYNPPPNPTKINNSHFQKYIQKYGPHSWEVDALDPSTLQKIIRAAFRQVIDMKKMVAIREQEKRDKEALLAAAATL